MRRETRDPGFPFFAYTHWCYSSSLHVLCVATGVTHAPTEIMNTLHLLNVFARLALLCLGVLLFTREGVADTPGLVFPQCANPLWDSMTLEEWTLDQLPGSMDVVASPGNLVGPILWIIVVTMLLIYDIARFYFVFSDRWHARDNQTDVTWSLVTCGPLPLLLVSTAHLLGHRDALILLLIYILALGANICGHLVEQVRVLVNPVSIPGMVATVVVVLRIMYDGLLLVTTQLTMVPFLQTLADPEGGLASFTVAERLSVHILTVLMLAITLTHYRHHRLCSVFEQTWYSHEESRTGDVLDGNQGEVLTSPGGENMKVRTLYYTKFCRSTTSWDTSYCTKSSNSRSNVPSSVYNDQHPRENVDSNDPAHSASMGCFPAAYRANSDSIGCPSLQCYGPRFCRNADSVPVADIATDTLSSKCGMSQRQPVNTTTRRSRDPLSDEPRDPPSQDTSDPFDVSASEALFNSIYGVGLNDSADVIQITGQDNRIMTVQLTDDFNMYNTLHRQGVMQPQTGMHVGQLGAGPRMFDVHLDKNGSHTRQMIGHLVEWRRYFIINSIMNALLAVNVLTMTGCL